MKHITCVTRRPVLAQGRINVFEAIVLFILQAFFSDWDNFQPVSQNLRKFYQKTP